MPSFFCPLSAAAAYSDALGAVTYFHFCDSAARSSRADKEREQQAEPTLSSAGLWPCPVNVFNAFSLCGRLGHPGMATVCYRHVGLHTGTRTITVTYLETWGRRRLRR